MAQKCRFSLAGCPSSLRTGDIYTHCLHGFKSTIIDGPSYVTSYDTQPNAVAPSVRADKNHLIAPVCLLSVPFSHEKPDHDLICQARLGTRSQKETPQLRTAFFLSQDSPPGDVSAFGIDPAVLAAKERGVFFDVGHGQGAGTKRFSLLFCVRECPPVVGGLHNTPLHAALHVSFHSFAPAQVRSPGRLQRSRRVMVSFPIRSRRTSILAIAEAHAVSSNHPYSILIVSYI
jgi:hypothetical protein